MTNIQIPTQSDWNTLIELKSYANRDSESSRAYYDFYGSYNWKDNKFEENGKVGLKNAFGQILVPALYDDVLNQQDAFGGYLFPVVVVELNEKYSLALRDGSGRTLCPFIYDDIEELDSEHYCVNKDEKYGIINNKGQNIFPCVLDSAYTDIIHLPPDVSAVVENNGKFGFVLRYTKLGYLGTPILINKYVNPVYEAWLGQEFDHNIGSFKGDLRIKKDGKWGYLDENAEFTDIPRKAYVGDESTRNLIQKERNRYIREQWWEEHPNEDRDIYYMDETNFAP